MKRPVCLWFSALICCCIIQTDTICLHPDVPENGTYTPKKSKAEPGDEITYSCKDGFALSGKETRKCKIGGYWTDHTPFCDPATRLKNPSVKNPSVRNPSGKEKELSVPHVIDGNTKTCFECLRPKDSHIYVHFLKKIIIRTMRIYLKKGRLNIRVLAGLNPNLTSISNHECVLESDQWIVIKSESKTYADIIKIEPTENRNFTICEIEVYGKTEESCDRSPNIIILHGHLEVSRSKAVLKCDKDYKEQTNKRLVCEGKNHWEGGPLVCEEEDDAKVRKAEEVAAKRKIKLIVAVVIALVLSIIIIALLVTIIYFIRKQKVKEVVVVYQPKSRESATFRSGREYEMPPYECLDNSAPDPPSTPRPIAKLSTMPKGGDVQSTTWKEGFLKNDPNLPEIVVGMMKPSAVYGS